MTPWITLTMAIPAVGALAVAMAPRDNDELAKRIALGFSLAAFVTSLALLAAYDSGSDAVFQLVEDHPWIAQFGIHYKVGVDGIALAMVLLTTFLTPIVVLASWRQASRVKSFFALFLVLETAMVGVFCALDLFLFYVFFEAMLVPMYFLIGVYGGERRVYAAVKFFLYTLLAGLLMLVSILGLYFMSRRQAGAIGAGAEGTFDYERLLHLSISAGTAKVLFLGFFIAFAVKVPVFPFHTWLPDAHTEAPTGGSVVLAAVMLKIGTFGFLRYAIPLFPSAARYFATTMMVLGVVGIIYGSLVAMVQKDVKRLVAYTSVAHLGFIVLGIFAFTRQSGAGGVLYMVNHGLSTGALFLVIGFLYERRHTRLIEEYGGVQSVTPMLAGAFLIAGLSSLALPGLNGFVSEFLVLVGTFARHRVLGVVATLGIVLAALYILIAYQRTMTGPITNDATRQMPDLDLREKVVIAPVLMLILGLGVYPRPVLDLVNPAVDRMLDRVERHEPAPTLDRGTGADATVTIGEG
ncbi:MAG TPA: NADH-quinone oxidoreductase subunit M [Frankiaceae bacterium]|jgi:NADH-quinone oxidoreductase subunit M|nr:NADH-quinone oxidoreductase subunit M [Frankiaceae bacterium]